MSRRSMIVFHGLHFVIIAAALFVTLAVTNKTLSLIADSMLLLVLSASLALYIRLRKASGGR